MQILEDLQNEVKDARAEIVELNKKVTELIKKDAQKPHVTIDTKEVASSVREVVSRSLEGFKEGIGDHLGNISRATANIPREIKVEGIWGFTNWKSLTFVMVVLMILTSFTTWTFLNYRESKAVKRLTEFENAVEELRISNPKTAAKYFYEK